MKHPQQNDNTASELMACHECDALQRIPALPPGRVARCRSCGHVLLRNPKGGLDRPLALYTAALILLVLANAFPFLTLDISGREEITTLFGASVGLYRAGMGELAVVVLITSILGPALLIISCLYVLLSVRFNKPLPAVRPALSWVSYLEPWGMLDVFMLGVLVSFVKLAGMATIHIGPSLYAFVALILVGAAATANFEPHILWQRLGIPGKTHHAG
ncbi:MAG: paraquat-inducible protein A [Gammaproteobacteria bacterium]|nr:MAG: paraquat-inducible protein A [Gammaproteobacteria bacterium]